MEDMYAKFIQEYTQKPKVYNFIVASAMTLLIGGAHLFYENNKNASYDSNMTSITEPVIKSKTNLSNPIFDDITDLFKKH